MNCKEYLLGDAMAVVAIPLASYDLALWQLTPTIASAAFSPTLSNAITIGLQPAVTGGTLIPIRRFTGKAKDEPSDSVAGRSHTVSVSCEVDDREGSVWDSLLALERTPSHLLLTFRSGERAFVSATQDSYVCQVARDGSKTSVSFRIQNWMGIQLIVP